MPRSATNPIGKPPKYLRSAIVRGLKQGPAVEETEAQEAVDPNGGDEGAGIIRGMAVITRGEALGHGYWIDGDTLSAVVDQMNAQPGGVKSRFTHPGLSSDGLGKYLGRTKNGGLDGDVVRGDLHFSQTAHETPDGDLASYVMKLADTDPEAFGTSIVFEHDFAAEEQFMLENGAHWEEDEWGRFLVGFQSPDPENVNNYPHTRLKELRAVDTVDEPAANPEGLFHRGQDFARDAEALVSYALGLSTERPQLSQLDIDPDRAGAFVKRFLNRHGLTLTHERPEMPSPKLSAATETTTAETKPAEGAATGAPAAGTETKPAEGETKPAETASGDSGKPAEQLQAGLPTGADFLKAFGEKGAVWFVEGKTFAEAQGLYNEETRKELESLKNENKSLKAKFSRGELAPASFSAGGDEKKEGEQVDVRTGLTAGQRRFAASLVIPGQKRE